MPDISIAGVKIADIDEPFATAIIKVAQRHGIGALTQPPEALIQALPDVEAHSIFGNKEVLERNRQRGIDVLLRIGFLIQPEKDGRG